MGQTDSCCLSNNIFLDFVHFRSNLTLASKSSQTSEFYCRTRWASEERPGLRINPQYLWCCLHPGELLGVSCSDWMIRARFHQFCFLRGWGSEDWRGVKMHFCRWLGSCYDQVSDQSSLANWPESPPPPPGSCSRPCRRCSVSGSSWWRRGLGRFCSWRGSGPLCWNNWQRPPCELWKWSCFLDPGN